MIFLSFNRYKNVFDGCELRLKRMAAFLVRLIPFFLLDISLEWKVGSR